MKKIIAKLLIVLSIMSMLGFQVVGNTYAGTIKVTVTEKIPGAGCEPEDGPGPYTCHIEQGFKSVTKMIGNIIKYFTYLVALAGVLFIVLNGILYSMGGADQSLKDESKKRIIGTLIGLVLLLLSGLILNLIAPWIYK